MILMRISGVLLILLGLVMRYIVKRRRFNRRGPAGLEHFSSYEKSWLTKLMEGSLNTLAIMFVIIGIALLVTTLDQAF